MVKQPDDIIIQSTKSPKENADVATVRLTLPIPEQRKPGERLCHEPPILIIQRMKTMMRSRRN